MIGDQMMMVPEGNVPMEIIEDEEAGEIEAGVPKRIRNPIVHVFIGIRRWIVGDYRWT